MEILPIEDAFCEVCKEKDEYTEYYHIYFATKYILQKYYYPFIKDANPYFTDHGIGHINRILRRLYDLLKPNLLIDDEIVTSFPRKFISSDLMSKKLNAYELYLLLCSVLWHDIGNLYGRKSHEEKIHKLFNKAKDFLHDANSSEWIVNICKAHSGIDAINKNIDRESKNEIDFTFYPRFLAALLRFSDELDEDKERIGEKLYEGIQEESKVYWFFCKCNDSIQVEVDENENIKIVVEGRMDRTEIFEKFKKEINGHTNEVDGIKEYAMRIDKINEERKYCNLHLKPHFFRPLDRIELKLRIYNRDDFLDELQFTFDDCNNYNHFLQTHDSTFRKLC